MQMQISVKYQLKLSVVVFAVILWQPLGILSAVVDRPKIEVAIGADFNISCTLNTKPEFRLCSNQHMYFQVDNDNFAGQRLSDNKTILLERHNATPHANRDYKCMCKGATLAKSVVAVGQAPLPVDDFSCRHYDFSHMDCSFSLPNNNLATEYTLSYWTMLSDSSQKIVITDCKFQKGSEVLCVLNDETRYWNTQKFAQVISFELWQGNALGNYSQELNFNDSDVLVPARPGQELKELNRTADSICWRWEMKGRHNYREDLVWEFEPSNTYKWRRSLEVDMDVLCLYDLPYANYSYQLELRAHVNASKSIWSEPLKLNFYTKPERPRRPPRVSSGGFFIYEGQTKLRFYWEQLQPHEYNGDNFTYVISEYSKNGENANPALIIIESNVATIPNWDKNSHYEISIRSRNAMGESLNASRLIIPILANHELTKRVPKDLHVNQSKDNTTEHTLIWKAPEDEDQLVDYIVFWCHIGLSTHSDCDGSIHFDSVNKSRRSFTVNAAAGKVLNMAVAAIYENHRSGGMQWNRLERLDIAKETWMIAKANGWWHSVEGVAAMLLLVLISVLLYRKYRIMSNIDCHLPLGIVAMKKAVLPVDDYLPMKPVPIIEPTKTTLPLPALTGYMIYSPEPAISSGYITLSTLAVATPGQLQSSDYIPMIPTYVDPKPVINGYVTPNHQY